MLKPIFTSLALLTGLLVLSGCITTGSKPSPAQSPYSQLQETKSDDLDNVWTLYGANSPSQIGSLFATYDKIIIEPVKLVPAEKDAFDDHTPEELRALSQQLHLALEEKLRKRFRLVKRPSSGTLRLTIHLTGVESANQILATTSSVMPVGLAISGLSKLLTGEHTNVGSASIKAAFADSQTNQVFYAFSDRHAGDKDIGTILDPLDDARDAINWWAEVIEKTIVNQHT